MEVLKMPPEIKPTGQLKEKAGPPLLEYRVTSKDNIPDAVYIGKIGNVNKFSLGNISAWTGAAKSKKTFAITMFAAAILGGLDLYGKFKSEGKHKILWIDTEQSKGDVKKVTQRINRMIGTDENLIMYALRPLSPRERVIKIDEALKAHPDIKVLIIDGVRDLIMNINNPEESTEIVTKLMKWSYDLNIHVSTVIHQSSAIGKARGHIGTEIENKAETVIKVIKDENDRDFSDIHEEYGRGKNIDDFKFFIDENGIPVVGETKFTDDAGTVNNWSDPDETPF